MVAERMFDALLAALPISFLLLPCCVCVCVRLVDLSLSYPPICLARTPSTNILVFLVVNGTLRVASFFFLVLPRSRTRV